MEVGCGLSPSRPRTTFGDDVIADYSPVRANFSPPRHGSAFWKRRRRSFVNTSSSEELQRVRALEKRLIRVNSAIEPYLDFRLSFAEDMVRGSLILVNRRRLSKSLSASPSTLFGPSESEVSTSEKKQREDVVNDLNQRCYACLFERVASEVERVVMCEETTPSLGRMESFNRYTCVHRGDKVEALDLANHPLLFDGSSLVKLYSTMHELCRTNDAIIYKARHRLTGVVYCIKRLVRLSSSMGRSKDSLLNALNESQALSALRHTNIVRYYNSWIESGSLFLQLEYCLGGSLLDCLQEAAQIHTATSASLSADGDDSGSGEYRMRALDFRQPASRVISDAVLTKLLSDIANALNYIHTKWCMAHKNVGLRTILVQLKPQTVCKALGSDKEMEKARERCHRLLLLGESNDLDFKLASFGGASRVSEAEDARGVDVYDLAVTLCLVAGGSGVSLADNALNEVDPSNVPPSLQPILQLMLKPLAADRVTASEVVEYLVATRNGSGGGTAEMDVC